MQYGRVGAVLWTKLALSILSDDDVRTLCQFHGIAAAAPHQLPGRIPETLAPLLWRTLQRAGGQFTARSSGTLGDRPLVCRL
jgi:hypothetical protein